MTPKHMKQRSPAMPVGAQPDLETKDLRETVRIGLAALTEQFLAKRNEFLAKAMQEDGLDGGEWSVQIDNTGVRYVRPRKPAREKAAPKLVATDASHMTDGASAAASS